MHTKAEKTTAAPAPGGLIELQNPSLGITLTGAIEISRFGLTPQPPICEIILWMAKSEILDLGKTGFSQKSFVLR